MDKSRGLEKRASGELTKYAPRVVIYGQFPYRVDPVTGNRKSGGCFSGAEEIMDALGLYLKERGLSDDGLVMSRQLFNIRDAFYTGRRGDRPAPEVIPESAPDLVFVLPQMRDYDDGGYSLDTPVYEIEAMCLEHGVPMVLVNETMDAGELGAALNQILGNEPLGLNPGPTQQ
ncbi:MAG TPA: hypothetical protein VLE74_01285 [Candidatus Saccharimonadales bacterium]|nr:hypothetical protein [Candidatus Saccharimonadales bacterium]